MSSFAILEERLMIGVSLGVASKLFVARSQQEELQVV
jgi:hypothetical protein